jgi:TolB-like protein/Tfp pilus assembly protein PilF
MPLMRDRVAHYKLIRNVGAGAMGEVYEAEDEHLKRRVAVKVIASAASGETEMRARFLREAHAAAAFSHPNVAHIYDVGTDDGIDYIAMEYIEGETLSARLARGSMTIDDIVDFALQLVDALAAAHDRGVVHRDIKPSNLMITPRGQVKMLDFGLARMEPAPAAHTDDTLDQSPGTRPGMILGTTSYMSPEQALGEEAASASDVFSVGVVLYEMIAGRLPFAGKTAADTLHRLTGQEPEPLARFNYDLPVELERIVRRCLEKTTSRRYRSAGELLVDLKSLARDRSSGVRAPRWAAAARPQTRRIAAIALIVIGIAALAVWGILVRHRAAPDPPPSRGLRAVAVLPFTISGVTGEEYVAFGDGITDSLIDTLADAGIRVMAHSTVFTFAHTHLTPQQVGRQLNVDAVVTADIRRQGDVYLVVAELVSAEDGARLWGNRYERKTSDLIGIEDDLASGVSDALQLRRMPREPAAAGVQRQAAHRLYLLGQEAMNERKVTAAAEYFRRATAADPTYARPYAALADTFTLAPRYLGVPTAALAPRAREAANKALQLEPALPDAHISMGSVYDICDWNWKGAEEEYRKAIRLRPGGDVLAYQWYGLLLTRLGRAAEARSEMQSAMLIDPRSFTVILAAANSAYYAGRYDEAATLCTRAIDMSPQYPLAHLQMAVIRIQQQRYAEAHRELEQGGRKTAAVALRGVLAAREHDATKAEAAIAQLAESGVDYEVAVVSAALGHTDSALQALDRACARREPLAGYANVDPLLASLHGNKAFESVMQRAGLL